MHSITTETKPTVDANDPRGPYIQMNKFNFKQNRTNFAFRTCGFWVTNKPNLKITIISYTLKQK